MPQGNSEPVSDLDQDRKNRLASMSVLMRVQVSRILTDELAKGSKLAGHLLCYCRDIGSLSYLVYGHPVLILVRPLSEVEM